jgi:hypothetical protein
MRKAALVSLPFLGFAIVLLVLNLREIDFYEFGTLQPPGPANNVAADDNPFQRVFPDLKFVHACSACGECVHPFEIVENRRVMSIHDHDGWYKLFWAADEEYYYSDPVHMIADWGGNRTAELPRGRWTLRLHAGPATHRGAPAHECGSIPIEIALAYDLVASDDPLEESFHSGDGPLKILQAFSWLVVNPGRPISLGWRLAGEPQIQADRCPCVKP